MTQQQASQFYNWYGYWPSGFGPDAKPAWVPTFEPQQFVSTDLGSVVLNPDYFATQETAMEIMKRFGADSVQSVKYQGSGGPVTSSARERWVAWRDGIACNAGTLAAQFKRNPEDVAPHVAENACWNLIAGARAQGQRLPKE